VEVSVRAAKEPVSGQDVVQVAVKNMATGETTLHAVAVKGGKLTVQANGGAGGSGGRGGKGGDGATGTNGGNGGQGGTGGNGGTGGRIVVTVDPSAAKYLDVLSFETRGGPAGSAGLKGDAGSGFSPGHYGQPGHEGFAGHAGRDGAKAEIRTGTVAALW
jgi:hypothetical protein